MYKPFSTTSVVVFVVVELAKYPTDLPMDESLFYKSPLAVVTVVLRFLLLVGCGVMVQLLVLQL